MKSYGLPTYDELAALPLLQRTEALDKLTERWMSIKKDITDVLDEVGAMPNDGLTTQAGATNPHGDLKQCVFRNLNEAWNCARILTEYLLEQQEKDTPQ